MEGRVAQPGQRGGQGQPGIAVGRGRHQRGRHEAGQRREQHRACADPVYQEAGQRLADAGNDEEHRHQQPELGVAEAEIADERREQRRQQHVKKMRGAVRHADEPDDGEIGARLGGSNGSSSHGV